MYKTDAGDTRMPCHFSDDEIETFLRLVKEKNVTQKIDGRTQRNIHIFQNLAATLNSDKTPEQWRSKWKTMKSKYLEENKRTNEPDATSSNWRFFDQMNDLFTQKAIVSTVNIELTNLDEEDEESDGDRDYAPSSSSNASEKITNYRAARMSAGPRSAPAPRGGDITNIEFLASMAEMIEKSNKKMMTGLGNIIKGNVSDGRRGDTASSTSQDKYDRTTSCQATSVNAQSRKRPAPKEDDLTNREFLASLAEMMEKSNKQLITGFGNIVNGLASSWLHPTHGATPQPNPSAMPHAQACAQPPFNHPQYPSSTFQYQPQPNPTIHPPQSITRPTSP